MTAKLVGLCGSIGAGKDTVAQIMVEQHGFVQLSFARRLKEWAHDLFWQLGVDERHFFGTQADKIEPIPGIVGPDGEPQTGRRILEVLGTDVARKIMPQVWVTLAILRAQSSQLVVFSDVRFANEIAAIRAAGGVVWEVVKIGGEQQSTSHVSDKEWRSLPKDAALLARAGDIEALELQVAQLVAQL